MATATSTLVSHGATRAADFINAIGVNIHVGKPGYGTDSIIADMAYLGLRNVRDHGIGALTPLSKAAKYGQLASAGLKFDWLTGGPIGPTMTALDTFLSAHPGAIVAIEGPNEVNNFPISYDGLKGIAAATAYQAALQSATEADPLTDSLPLLSYTGAAPTPGLADAANLHVYPKAGAQPLALLSSAVASMQRQMPGAPIYVTEAGYFTLPGRHGWEGVDDATQAKLTLNLIMDAAKLGVTGLYLYDLIDDGVDTTLSHAGDHFGLFTTTGLAKPSAVAIHDLSTILTDSGAAAASFSPAPLTYAVSGLPPSGSSLVLEKSSGEYDVVLWAEPTIWNATTHTPVSDAPNTVTVSFAAPFAHVRVFDPMTSSAPVQSLINASAVTVSLVDHPLVIQVTNFVQAMAAAGANVAAAPLAPTGQGPSPLAPVLATP
jgi:hypothetical protein